MKKLSPLLSPKKKQDAYKLKPVKTPCKRCGEDFIGRYCEECIKVIRGKI